MALIHGLPAHWYTDSEVFLAERDEIFARGWIYVTHTDALPEPGSYVAEDVAGLPIAIVRQQDNSIRAYRNICPHRGSRVFREAEGCLTGQSIMCGYHGWTFALNNGALLTAPVRREAECQGLQLGLTEVPLTLVGDLIFVNVDGEAAPLFEQSPEIEKQVTARLGDFAGFKYLETRVHGGDFNWKVWIEGFQECYHCPIVHPDLQRDFSLSGYEILNYPLFSAHVCTRKAESVTGGNDGVWFWMFPNLGIPCYEDVYYTLRVNPLGAGKTRLSYRYYVRDLGATAKNAEFVDFVDRLAREDIEMCCAVQKNASTGLIAHGYVVENREPGVRHFHTMLRERVGGRLGRPALRAVSTV